MDLNRLIKYLLDDVGIPKKKVSELLECDPKTVTNMEKGAYIVGKIPQPKSMVAGTSLEEVC